MKNLIPALLSLFLASSAFPAEFLKFKATSFAGARTTDGSRDPVTRCEAEIYFGDNGYTTLSVYMTFKSGSYDTITTVLPKPALAEGKRYQLNGQLYQANVTYLSGVLTVDGRQSVPDSYFSHLERSLGIRATTAPNLRSLGSIQLLAKDRQKIWFGGGDRRVTQLQCRF